MKKLLDFLITLFSVTIFFGFLYIKVTRRIYEIPLNMAINPIYYSLIFCFFISSFVLLLALVFNTLFIKKREPSKIVIFLATQWQKINILKKSYGIIFEFFSPTYSVFLISIVIKVLDWSKTFKIILILLFVFLPRILVILTLILDVFFLQSLHYYFYSLLFLLFPVFFRLFIFVLEDIGPRLLLEFNEGLVFDTSNKTAQVIEINNEKKQVNLLGVKFAPKFAHCDLDHFIHNFYNPVLFIEGEMETKFKPLYSKITILSILLYLSVTTTVFGYIAITFIL